MSGVAECAYMEPGRDVVFLKSRRGFVRAALLHGERPLCAPPPLEFQQLAPSILMQISRTRGIYIKMYMSLHHRAYSYLLCTTVHCPHTLSPLCSSPGLCIACCYHILDL